MDREEQPPPGHSPSPSQPPVASHEPSPPGLRSERRHRSHHTQSSSSTSASSTPTLQRPSRQRTPLRQNAIAEDNSAREIREIRDVPSPATALLEISSSSSEENIEGHPNRKVAIEKLPQSRTPKARKRVIQACNECRTRKTKCTGEEPRCSLCVQYDRECTYADTEAQLAKKDVVKVRDKLEQDVRRYRSMMSDLLDGLKVVDRQGVLQTLQEMQDEVRDEPQVKRRRVSEDDDEPLDTDTDVQSERRRSDDPPVKLEDTDISMSDLTQTGAISPTAQVISTMQYRMHDPAMQHVVPQMVPGLGSSSSFAHPKNPVASALTLERRRQLSPGLLRRLSEPDVVHRSVSSTPLAGPSSITESGSRGKQPERSDPQDSSSTHENQLPLSPRRNVVTGRRSQRSRDPYQLWGTTIPPSSLGMLQSRDPSLVRENSQSVGFTDLESRQFHNPDLPAHLAQPLNSVSTQPFSRVYTDFCRQQRQSIAIGEPYRELSPKAHRDAGALIDRKLYQIAHPLDRWAVDVLNVFSNQFQGPAIVAYKYLMTVLMQWQISPTPENYSKVPEWLRPTPTQLFVPHPAWIDYLPWPKVRDFIILRPELGQSEDFLVPLTTCVSVGWSHDSLKTVFEDNGYIISKEFETHIRCLANWRVADRFLRSFPHLSGFITVDPDYDGHPL